MLKYALYACLGFSTPDTDAVSIVLVVFMILGILAMLATIGTALIYRKVRKATKRKKITSEEALAKYRALGEKTDLK